MRSRIHFYGPAISFLFGVIISLLFYIQNLEVVFLFFILLTSALILRFKTIIFCFVFIGIFYTNIYEFSNYSLLKEKVGEKVYLEGVIISEPDIRENLTIYKFKPGNFDESIRVFYSHYPKFEYGDRVSLKGVLELPENFENDNGIEFNYISFLSQQNIYTVSFRPQIQFVDNSSASFKTNLFNIKNNLIESSNQILEPPYSALAAGLIFGAKQSLGKELLEKFRIAGLIHVVVLSGFNIAIIAEAIKRSFIFLPRTISFLFSTFSIISFAMLVGGGSTVVRATIMVFIVLLARFLFRNYAVNRSLMLAALIMVLINPRIILFDPGFILSFVATLGLVHITPLLQKILFFIPEKFGLQEIITSTIATQIAVLPLLVFMTGEISIVSLIVNILVLPTIPITMLLGFLASLIGLTQNPTGLLLGFVTNLILKYQIFMVEFFANLPFATFVF